MSLATSATALCEPCDCPCHRKQDPVVCSFRVWRLQNDTVSAKSSGLMSEVCLMPKCTDRLRASRIVETVLCDNTQSGLTRRHQVPNTQFVTPLSLFSALRFWRRLVLKH